MSGTPPQHQVTQLLTAWQQGDEKAMEALVPLVYKELHRLAENYLWREGSAATLQPTARGRGSPPHAPDPRGPRAQDKEYQAGG